MVLVVLLGWAVALLNRRARHKSLVTIVGTLLFLAVYYAVFQWVGNSVEALAVDAVQAGAAAGRAAAPLRLLGLAAVATSRHCCCFWRWLRPVWRCAARCWQSPICGC